MASVTTRSTVNNLRLFSTALLVTIALAGCSKQADNKDTPLSRATAFFAADQFDKAEKEYREVLRVTPNDPVALRQLGIIYQEQRQLPQAYLHLKQAADRLPDDANVQLRFGQILLALGQRTEAREAAIRVLDKEQGHLEALQLLADSAAPSADSFAETRGVIESRRGQDRDRAGYHLALGTLDLRQREEARAESEFKAALQLDPKLGVAHEALGLLYWSRNDLKNAEQEFKNAAELAPTRSSMRLRYADFLQKTGATAEAAAFLEEMGRKLPDYLPPRVALMRMACAKRQDDDCIARVQNILAQDFINYDALFQDGILNLAKGDALKAIREFEQLSSVYAQNPQVRYQLGVAYLLSIKTAAPMDAQKGLTAAENSLSEAVKLDPKFQQAALLLAELKMRKGSPAAAVDLLAPLANERVKIAPAYTMLASAYQAQGQGDQALATYRRMAEVFPQDPQPLMSIGRMLQERRDLAGARAALEKSVSISSGYLPAIERLVDLDITEQKFAAAISRIQEQVDRDPKVALAWAVRAKIYLAQRDFARAEPDLLKAIDLDSNFEAAYILLAQLYVASNRPEMAIEKLNSYIEKKPTVPALMTLASIQERAKNFTAARDAYEKALTVTANFLPALNNLAVLYSEHLGQPDKAYDSAKKARDLAPNEPHAADTLGWVLFKRAEYRNALPLLQESAGKLPDSAEVQFHLGMTHYMLGQDDAARVALQKATGATTDFPGKDDARRRLAVLAIPTEAASPANRAELDKFVGEMPNDPAALFRLAKLREKDGAIDEAIKIYEKIIGGNPLYAPAMRQQAILYSRRDDPKAFDLVTKARQTYPDDPEVAKWLGVQSYRRDYHARAADLLKEAAAKRSDDAETLYYLGESQRQLKQWPGCKASLERALSLKLASALADKAKSALAECSESASP